MFLTKVRLGLGKRSKRKAKETTEVAVKGGQETEGET